LDKENDHVIVTDGKAIYRVSQTGQAHKLATLAELQREGSEEKGVQGSICWFFATSSSRDDLFFVLASDSSARHSICRLQLATRKVQLIEFPFPAGIDVDVDEGVVFGAESPKQILARDFDGKIDKRCPVSTAYYLCRLSPDKKLLLLSNPDSQPESNIA